MPFRLSERLRAQARSGAAPTARAVALLLALGAVACTEPAAQAERPCAVEDNQRFVRSRNPRSQVPVVWAQAVAHDDQPPPPCLELVLDPRSHPALAADTLAGAARDAFDAWAAPPCSPLCFELRPADDATLAAEPAFRPDGPNASIVLVETGEDAWQARFGNHALAATLVTSDLETGHILDADLLLNAADYVFVDAAREACPEARYADLRSVLTHEAGHFLGLAHTSDPASTLFGGAPEPTADGRCDASQATLAEGDVDGICTVYRARCTSPDDR